MITDIDKYKKKLEKMTKEQLVREVLIKDAEVRQAIRDRSNDNEIAKAIKEGMQQLAFSNSQAGITINREQLENRCTTALEVERERQALIYKYLKELEEYKSEPHREIMSKDLDKFTEINPHEMTRGYLESLIDIMQKDRYNQNLYNRGYSKAIEVASRDKRNKKLPELREFKSTTEFERHIGVIK